MLHGYTSRSVQERDDMPAQNMVLEIQWILRCSWDSPPGVIEFFGWKKTSTSIWVNYNISLPWITRRGWFPYIRHDSQRGRCWRSLQFTQASMWKLPHPVIKRCITRCAPTGSMSQCWTAERCAKNRYAAPLSRRASSTGVRHERQWKLCRTMSKYFFQCMNIREQTCLMWVY